MSAPTSRDSWPSWTLPSTRTMMRSESTESTTPARLQITTAPESRAVTCSMPVPTKGASARSSGTAWRCMFEPISARLASSFSRNGMRQAATETSCFGLTSMYSISSRCFSTKLPAWRALTSSGTMRPFSSSSTLACAMTYLSSSQAERYSQWASYSAGCFLAPSSRLAFFDRLPRHDVADLERRVAGVEDPDLVHHRALDHLAVGALDEAVLVDARKAGERRDQTDVRTFRRFDRADAAVVRRVHVADFESGALARQTARSKRRQAPLVGDLRERVGLVHELRKLAGAEELADGRHHRLGVHQVVRHGRRHFLVDRHLFLDGALHAHQADAELVFEQFAHRAHAAVAQVIDVVHRADALAQLEQVPDGVAEIVGIERALVERGGVAPCRTA